MKKSTSSAPTILPFFDFVNVPFKARPRVPAAHYLGRQNQDEQKPDDRHLRECENNNKGQKPTAASVSVRPSGTPDPHAGQNITYLYQGSAWPICSVRVTAQIARKYDRNNRSRNSTQRISEEATVAVPFVGRAPGI